MKKKIKIYKMEMNMEREIFLTVVVQIYTNNVLNICKKKIYNF